MQLGFHFSNILLALRYSHIPIKVSPLEVYRYNSVVCVKQTQTTPGVQHLMNVDNVLHVQSSSKWLACYPLSGLLSIDKHSITCTSASPNPAGRTDHSSFLDYAVFTILHSTRREIGSEMHGIMNLITRWRKLSVPALTCLHYTKRLRHPINEAVHNQVQMRGVHARNGQASA